MENTKLLVTVLSFVMLAAFLMPSMRNVGVTQETTLPPVATPVHNISTGLNYTTIQAAIDAPETMDGHMLMCDAGNYTENVNVYKSLKIVGAGPTITWLVPSEPNDTIGISVSDVTIEGFTVQSVSGYSGVLLNEVSGCNISNNVLTGEGWGIFLRGSNDNVISGNTMYSLSANGVTLSDSSLRNQVISNIMNQNHYGICVYNASNYNVISGNMVNSSDWDGIRLNWQGSNCAPVAFNNVTNNVATHSGDAGIFVDTPSPYNLLEDNFLSDDYIGMRLRQTNSSTLVRNTIVSNSYRGISAESSYGNIVYDNFLNNTNNAWDNGANLWNTTRTQATNVLGRPFTGGNYWSDASNLPDKDNDGIGETGYSVPGGNNVDMLPLVQSYIDVVPLEYDPTTQTGTIRWKVDPTAFYRSELEANGTVFDQIDLPSRNYYGQAACGIPSDLLLGYTADVGGPEIPVVKLCIGIPPEMEPESYPIGDVECVGTIENTLVLPVPTYEAPESSPTYVMNTTVYSSSVPYPSGWSAQPNVGSLYGLKTVTIELHPVQYIPANGTVYVYKMEGSIDLKGQFEGGVPQQADEKALNEEIPNLYEAKYWPAQIFSASAKMLVPARPPSPVNLEAIAVLNSIHLCPTSQPEPPYSILIISADNFATQAAALAYEKSTRSSNPIPTAWIKVSEILSVLQDFASVGSDIPSMIREFIRVLYDYFSPRPEYVILLGDAPMLGITFANSLPTIKDAEGNYHSGIYDCYKYPLGSDIHHQAYAQSFTAGADGVVSITLLLNRTFDIPNYGITVSIQAGEVDNGPNGHVLTSFDIDQSDLKAEVSKDSIGGWALTHNFAYVTSTGTAQLDPSKTYFLVINADNVNAAAYYYIYTEGNMLTDYEKNWYVFRPIPYEPTGYFWSYDPSFYSQQYTNWFSHQDNNEDLIFRFQIYNSTSVPAIFVKNTAWSDLADPDYPTDDYYSCLSNSWDPNGNGQYLDTGAECQSIDFGYQVAVGRLPAGNSTEANTMVGGIMAYETGAMASGFCAGSVVYQPNDTWPDAQGANDIYTLLNRYVSPTTKAYQDQNSLVWWYENHYGTTDPTTPIAFANAFNNGTDAVYMWAHGYPDNCGNVYVDPCTLESNASFSDGTSVVLKPTEHFPVIFAQSCLTAYFDMNLGDPYAYNPDWALNGGHNKHVNCSICLGEAFVDFGVASSYIGSVRSCGASDGGLAPDFWSHYCTDADYRTGDALRLAKYDCHGYSHEALVKILLGDPETCHYRPAAQPSSYACPIPPSWFNNLDPTINFTYTNLNETLYLPNRAPWEIVDPYGNSIYTPPAQQVVTPVPPHATITWTWNGTMSNGTQVSTPGRYQFCLHTLNGTLGHDFYMLRSDAWVFTTKPSYTFGEPVTVGFRNMGNKTLIVDMTVRRGARISGELTFSVSPGGDVENPFYVEASTGQLNPPGDYTVEAVAEDPQGKTYNYTTELTILPNPPFISTTVAQTSTHDIATVSLETQKTVVGQGFPARINVTVENAGSFRETTTISIYVNTTSIASQSVTFSGGSSANIASTWNTTGFAYGNYTLCACATPVPGETDTSDNNYTCNITVKVVISGDVNGDGIVNILDAITLSNAFSTTPGSKNWNPNADINGDGAVNILDAIIMASHFNEHL